MTLVAPMTSSTFVPLQTPPWQVSPVVQYSPSLQLPLVALQLLTGHLPPELLIAWHCGQMGAPPLPGQSPSGGGFGIGCQPALLMPVPTSVTRNAPSSVTVAWTAGS